MLLPARVSLLHHGHDVLHSIGDDIPLDRICCSRQVGQKSVLLLLLLVTLLWSAGFAIGGRHVLLGGGCSDGGASEITASEVLRLVV